MHSYHREALEQSPVCTMRDVNNFYRWLCLFFNPCMSKKYYGVFKYTLMVNIRAFGVIVGTKLVSKTKKKKKG